MSVAALLLGAGRGERLGGGLPKAFLALGGRPLLEHAVTTVESCPEIDGFVAAVPPGWVDRARALVDPSPKLLGVVEGGRTRQESVRAALGAVPPRYDAIVCHDVARPLASPKLFSAVLAPLDRADGAIPVIPVSDTVKRVRAELVVATVDRHDLALAQTPQAFRRAALERGHRKAGHATDDAALVEAADLRVAVVPGEPTNVKITVPSDLRVAEALLSND
jgi:2-C-methyl-D-erythritol 4-phosphate cytidylyltransferase